MRRDFPTRVFLLVIIVISAMFVYRYVSAQKAVEVRELDVEGYHVELPGGFRMLTEDEKKSFGFSKSYVVLTRGDMGHLIIIDVEKNLPQKLYELDLKEYYELTLEELEKNVLDFKLVDSKKDKENFEYYFIYTGKNKENERFLAAYYSKLDPGTKINFTIAVPEAAEGTLEDYLEKIRSGLVKLK